MTAWPRFDPLHVLDDGDDRHAARRGVLGGKAAYGGLGARLAAEYGPQGVRVNAIAPGWIASPMLDKALAGDTARRAKILSRTPLGRFGEPDDIGWTAVYLSSPAAKFVTGTILTVDGGRGQRLLNPVRPRASR